MAMAMATVSSSQVLLQQRPTLSSKLPFSSAPFSTRFLSSQSNNNRVSRLAVSGEFSGFTFLRASPENSNVTPAGDDEEGVSLGTMKLPMNTDLNRFETLLFQWANSLCQGAQLPLPMPLKVDKIQGGVRIGFITIGDGATEVPVYIDCLVFPAAGGSGPVFRAIRDGPKKGQSPPGEPRIMKSLLGALQKSVELATL